MSDDLTFSEIRIYLDGLVKRPVDGMSTVTINAVNDLLPPMPGATKLLLRLYADLTDAFGCTPELTTGSNGLTVVRFRHPPRAIDFYWRSFGRGRRLGVEPDSSWVDVELMEFEVDPANGSGFKRRRSQGRLRLWATHPDRGSPGVQDGVEQLLLDHLRGF